MLTHEIDAENGILIVTPSGELTAMDFKSLTDTMDEYNATHEPLRALMIFTEDFPGWDSFGALFQHLKFVRRQRDQIKKVAAVSDSGFLTVMPHIVDHFIKAEVRHFDYEDKAQALAWLTS
jgi:stage II sporulation SpoAA-like protein